MFKVGDPVRFHSSGQWIHGVITEPLATDHLRPFEIVITDTMGVPRGIDTQNTSVEHTSGLVSSRTRGRRVA